MNNETKIYLYNSFYSKFKINYLNTLKSTDKDVDNKISSFIQYAFSIFNDDDINRSYRDLPFRETLYYRIRDYVLLSLSSEENINAFLILRELYTHYSYKQIKMYYQKYNHYIDSQMISDISDDMFTHIWNVKDKYDPIKSCFSTWFNYIIRNKILLAINKNKREELFYDEELQVHLNSNCIKKIIPIKNQYSISPEVLFLKNIYSEDILHHIFTSVIVYPWKMIIYLLSLIGYKPKEITENMSNNNLQNIFFKVKEYFLESNFEKEFVNSLFITIEQDMSKRLGSVISIYDYYTLKKLNAYKDLTVKNIPLNVFFQKNPNHTITDWISKVKKKVSMSLVEYELEMEKI